MWAHERACVCSCVTGQGLFILLGFVLYFDTSLTGALGITFLLLTLLTRRDFAKPGLRNGYLGQEIRRGLLVIKGLFSLVSDL